MKSPTMNSEEVLQSWNRCHGAFYRLDAADLRWNMEAQRLVRYWSEPLGNIPALWAEAAEDGAAMGILPKAIWLSVFGDISVGQEQEFVSAVEKFARGRGKSRVAIGSDEFHFLPGIPEDEPMGARLAEACKAQGWTTADNADFVGAPLNPQSRGYVEEAVADANARGWTLRAVESPKDHEELSEFMLREFPGRWTREWICWRTRPDTARGFWNLLRDENKKVLGFSRLARRGRLAASAGGWTPGAMRLPLDPGNGRRDTDSCLGPIGISKAERGRGAGKILLGLSIQELSLQGAELTCIDWTNAYNYYTPLGFRIVRRYRCAWKELPG